MDHTGSLDQNAGLDYGRDHRPIVKIDRAPPPKAKEEFYEDVAADRGPDGSGSAGKTIPRHDRWKARAELIDAKPKTALRSAESAD